MSYSAMDRLTQKKIQQLLAAVGSRPAEDSEKTEAVEYDWQQPRYFSGEQLSKLNEFTKKTAAVIAEKFGSIYKGKFTVTISSTSQHFAGQITGQNEEGNEKDPYYLTFGPEAKPPCGVVGIPQKTAFAWVTQLLGDSEAEQILDRSLSQLEESLLFDTTSVFVKALFGGHKSCDFQPGKSIIQGQMPLKLEAAEQLCKITFEIKKDQSESGDLAHVLICCASLNAVAGKSDQADSGLAAKDVSQRIVNHLQQISVPVTVQLGFATLSFEEIMALQVNDVILLNKKVGEGAEVVMQGQRLLQGQLARSKGKKALVITESIV